MILLALLIVPLAAGPLAFLLRRRRVMEMINLAAFAILFGMAVVLVAQVLRSGSVSLWNGFFYADALSALVVLLSAFVALVCSIYAVGYFRHDESQRSSARRPRNWAAASVSTNFESTTLLRLCLFSP